MPVKMQERMAVAYENSASCSYLVVMAGENEQILDYQVSMLECNRPEYMLPMEIKRENETVHFYFDITSRLTLEFLLKRKSLKRNEFVRLLTDVARSLADCDGYLLIDSGFLLDAGFIYIDPETLKIYLAYIPVRSGRDTAEVFKTFVADLILHHASIEESGSDNFLQRILGFVKRDNFNIRGFLELLEELVYQPRLLQGDPYEAEGRLEAAVPVKELSPVGSGVKKNSRLLQLLAVIGTQCLIAAAILSERGLFEGVTGKVYVTYGAIVLIILAIDVLLFKRLFYGKVSDKAQEKKPQREARPDFAKVSAMSEPAAPASAAARPPAQGKTELLGSIKPAFPTLRSRNSQEFEEILIDKPDFVIGRLPDQVDHVCKNNAVGKVHALITVREGSIRIRDLNSVNGTFINESRIESNRDVEVRDNDCIMLANSEYVLICK